MSDEVTVLGQRLRLRQIPDGFKTSIDAVLLAAACPAKSDDRVLDLGCGVGSAGLSVLTRVEDTQLTGVDVLPDHVALARENAEINALDARTTFIAEDIRDFEPGIHGAAPFDHVICNPPYLNSGAHIQSPSAHKQLAIGLNPIGLGEDAMDLKDWLDAGHRNLRSGGSMTIINRADATDKIIRDMGRRFGAIEIIPLWPKLSVNAKRVIIRGIKDRKSPSTLHTGVVLHRSNGDYTDAAEEILRNAQALCLDKS
ncbi:MAG: tRNA1(Val) (adenine(37)-N6)-methyltransferase [Bdellovibrionales bacterium]